jgi:hypothetical protein
MNLIERGLWVRDGAIWLVGERQSHPVGVVPRTEIQGHLDGV